MLRAASLLIALGVALLPVLTSPAPAADQAGEAVRRGHALLKKQDLVGARAAFSEAIRIDPKFAEAYVGRAAATPIQATGDHKPVRADLDRAIRLDPYLASAYAARAELRSEWENDKPGALQDYGKAVEMAPRDPVLRVKRALFLDDQAQLDPAVADLSDALRFDPRNVAVLSIRAAVLDRKGELDRAIADYDTAIRLSTVFGASGFATEAELQAANVAMAGDDALMQEFVRLDGLYKARAALLRTKGLHAQAAQDDAAAKRVPQRN